MMMMMRHSYSLVLLIGFWMLIFNYCTTRLVKSSVNLPNVKVHQSINESNKMIQQHKIPVHLLMQLREIANMDELFEKMIEPSQRYKRRGLKSAKEFTKKRNRKNKKIGKSILNDTTINLTDDDGGGGGNNGGSDINPVFDKRAFCQPRRQPVDIPQPKDSTLIYQPPCLQIERCGGCCSHELFQCVPSSIKNVTRKVAALRYPHAEAEYFVLESLVRVRVERHTKCQCQCKTQPEDCSARQIYDRENCRCVCSQMDGHTKCKDPQIWIEKECRCRCPEYSECSSGTYFDTRMCRCRVPGEILTQGKMLRLMSKSLHHK